MPVALVALLLLAAAGAVAAAVLAARRSSAAAHEAARRATVADAAASSAAATAGRLSAALSATPQGVVVCDETGTEVFRNGVAAAYTGARHGEALVERAVHEQLASALAGRPGLQSVDLVGPPRRSLVLSSVALDDGARTTGAVVVIDDASERRRLEAVRRDFVANISHELKTPVGALGLLAETIAAEQDPVVLARLADRMTDEAFRVARIIDDLLDLSRIEAGEGPRAERLTVTEVVAEACARVGPLARARHIGIDVSGVSGRHHLRGDRRQLESAVGNLLENACKYSDEGSVVEIRSHADGAWVELDVCDHGIGIPTRDHERVFERFYRVDRARSRETGGTGLGLAIVRHVVANHGGQVRLESREGEGSTFTLRLPSLGTGETAVLASTNGAHST